MPKHSQDGGKKPQPPSTETEKDQGVTNHTVREENARQSKVIPFPQKRDSKKGSNRGNK